MSCKLSPESFTQTSRSSFRDIGQVRLLAFAQFKGLEFSIQQSDNLLAFRLQDGKAENKQQKPTISYNHHATNTHKISATFRSLLSYWVPSRQLAPIRETLGLQCRAQKRPPISASRRLSSSRQRSLRIGDGLWAHPFR